MPSKQKAPVARKCSEIIPEEVIPVKSEMIEIEPPEMSEFTDETTGKTVKLVTKQPVFERKIITETIPAHECDSPATTVARDLEEVKIPGIVGQQFKITKDDFKCSLHQKQGTITWLSGEQSNHAVMSIDDWSELS